MEEAEQHCESKIKLITNDVELNSLSKLIFNCTTMEEIFEIKRLIEK